MTLNDLILILSWLFLSAIFSGSEIGLYSLSRVKLHYRSQYADRRAHILQRLITPIGPTIIAILIANNLTNMMLTTTTERIFRTAGPWGVLLTAVVVSPVVLLCGEFLPKYWFRTRANALMHGMAPMLSGLRLILAPAIVLAHGIARLINRLAGNPDQQSWVPYANRFNLRSFLHHNDAGHNLSPVQKELIDRVMALERIDCTYAKAIKPLASMICLDGGATIAAACNGLSAPYYQRYLVSAHDHGRPIGWISAATLASADGALSVESQSRPLPTLPARTSLAEALQRMHQDGADLALVAPDGAPPDSVLLRSDCLRILARLI